MIPYCLFSSISDIRLGVESTSSNNSNYGSRGALAWTPPASMEGSTPTWTEGTPSFTESSSSGEIGEPLPLCHSLEIVGVMCQL